MTQDTEVVAVSGDSDSDDTDSELFSHWAPRRDITLGPGNFVLMSETNPENVVFRPQRGDVIVDVAKLVSHDIELSDETGVKPEIAALALRSLHKLAELRRTSVDALQAAYDDAVAGDQPRHD